MKERIKGFIELDYQIIPSIKEWTEKQLIAFERNNEKDNVVECRFIQINKENIKYIMKGIRKYLENEIEKKEAKE